MSRAAFEWRVRQLAEAERARQRDLVLCQADVRLQAALARIVVAKLKCSCSGPLLLATLEEAEREIGEARKTLISFFDNPEA